MAIISAAPVVAQELRRVGFQGFGGSVYDPVRQRVVVPQLGGYSFEWDGVSWRRAPDRDGVAGYCYVDPSRDLLVAVQEDGWGFGETLQFFERTGHEWDRQYYSGGPTDRWGVTLAYDSHRGELVAFGGYDPNVGSTVGGTWTFDGANWQQHAVAEPPARSFATAAFDQARQRVVMFGGLAGAGTLADTWEWDGSNWTQVAAPTTPPSRGFGGMTFDSGRGVIVMAGGSDNLTQMLDLWEYDGVDWQQRTQPPVPVGASFSRVVYDAARSETLLLGWWDGQMNLGAVLAWDGTSWSSRPGLGASVPASSFGTSSRDHTGALVLRLGGQPVGGTGPAATLTAWDGTTWTNLATGGPSARSLGAMWPMANATFLFGGFDAAGAPLGDTWQWDGSNWSQQTLVASPPARGYSAVAFHAGQGTAILFGGSTTGGNYGAVGDTWRFDGVSWQQLTTGPQPGARRGHSMAYDPIRGRIVLSGGLILSPFPGGSTIYDDTWEHDGVGWTQVLVTGGPQQFLNGSYGIAWDENRQKIVAISSDSNLYTVAEYDGVAWTQLAVDGDAWSAHPLLASELQVVTGPTGNAASVGWGIVVELLSDPAGAEEYGTACTVAAPNLLASELPNLGQASFALEVTLAPASGIVAIAAGHQSANVPVLGCDLLVQPITTALHIADAQGYVRSPLPIPANTALLGSEFFFQGAVLDPAAPSGLTFSRGLQLTLGE